jgi:hypothetical protein
MRAGGVWACALGQGHAISAITSVDVTLVVLQFVIFTQLFHHRRISTSRTQALKTPETREKINPGASQYSPAGEPRSNSTPEIL